jgi:hypothetical protein
VLRFFVVGGGRVFNTHLVNSLTATDGRDRFWSLRHPADGRPSDWGARNFANGRSTEKNSRAPATIDLIHIFIARGSESKPDPRDSWEFADRELPRQMVASPHSSRWSAFRPPTTVSTGKWENVPVRQPTVENHRKTNTENILPSYIATILAVGMFVILHPKSFFPK